MGFALTLDHLLASGVPPTLAKRMVDPLRAACALHAIDTKGRLAAFLGQAIVESSGFVRLDEVLTYSSAQRILDLFPSRVKTLAQAQSLVRKPVAFANCVYAGKNGNGDEASGDGYRFHGRGIFQLTGRAWYERAGRELGRPYLEQPDLLLQPSDACLSAAWYWKVCGCNELADARQLDAITKAINGPAMDQAARRRTEANEMLAILNTTTDTA
ncbi:glycoside hydrolase family 19 [Aquabacterium olei]|uniref:Glycoside hydrolase family 19 n=1 Tax=Aquabacterium olei TaxID=1296669 RepID=A0A2U8FQ98_9BURK|nr:glycoside hydrolase family 19 protein [Aquabacterium olei]AWI53225.1 glycoside hydrolase family 19 [Aquabacterium olei]